MNETSEARRTVIALRRHATEDAYEALVGNWGGGIIKAMAAQWVEDGMPLSRAMVDEGFVVINLPIWLLPRPKPPEELSKVVEGAVREALRSQKYGDAAALLGALWKIGGPS